MARFTNGWVKLHRKILSPVKENQDSNPFYGDGYMRTIFMDLVSWAHVQNGETAPKGFKEPLKIGQCVTSLNELVESTGFNKNIIRKRLVRLEKNGILHTLKHTAGTLVTILKYEEYQGTEKNSTQEGTLKAHYIEEREKNYNNNSSQNYPPGKKSAPKNDAPKKPKPSPKYKFEQWQYDLAQKWEAYHQEIFPTAKTNIEKSANTIRIITDKSLNLNENTFPEFFEAIKRDSFWFDKALSLENLNRPSSSDKSILKFEKVYRDVMKPKRASSKSEARSKIAHDIDELFGLDQIQDELVPHHDDIVTKVERTEQQFDNVIFFPMEG